MGILHCSLWPVQTINFLGTAAGHLKGSEIDSSSVLPVQVPVKAQRDPSRLYKLTKGWEERKKATLEPGEGGAAVGASLPKRAVPTWRQGV